MEELDRAMDDLVQHRLTHLLPPLFFHSLQQRLSSVVKPDFWKHFEHPIGPEAVFEHLKTVFDKLYDEVAAYLTKADRLYEVYSSSKKLAEVSAVMYDAVYSFENDYKLNVLTIVKAILFSQTNENLLNALHVLYSRAFKAFDATRKREQALCGSSSAPSVLDDSGLSDEAPLCCEGCERERDACLCAQLMATFHHLNRQWRELGLLDCLSGEAVTSLIKARVRQHVEHTCKGNFEIQYLQILQEWLESKVVCWLELLYGKTEGEESSPIQAHKDRLYHYMYEMYARVRIEQLFNIIIEYPESEPALLDLRACLKKISLRTLLVTSLKAALETRLLHPGVNTTDILTAYISAIRSLRALDPAGVLLELVCQPVTQYLRQRKDTVRCIVTSLTEDGNTELSDELVSAQPLVLSDSYHSDDADPTNDDWASWQPDPVDADPLKSGGRRSSDIISMLVNIYGSKDMFVTEYQTLLADRILTQFSYDTEKEIRYLELLKLRFGEADLHNCEVMLKDVADSKRINTNIVERKEKQRRASHGAEQESEEDEAIPVSGMILSAQFWPAFREEKLQLPGEVQASLDTYTKGFEALKGSRTLAWKPHLGLVDLELELEDRILTLNVTPTQAAIIYHFQNKARWTVEELSAELHMSAPALRRKIAFWQSHGLLREECADSFVLVEKQAGGGSGRGHHDVTAVIEEDEAESAMASAQDLKEEEMQVIWQFIVGMLTNLESLPLDRIHSMLKMFAMQGASGDYSIQELKAFLDKKVKDQKLVCSSGVYRLVKNG